MSKNNLKNKRIPEKQNIYFLIPLVFIIAIVPLLVYVRYYSLDKMSAQLLNEGSKVVDVFGYYKSLYFLIAVTIGLIIFMVKASIQKVRIKLIDIYIPMAVYSFFVILSAFLSKQKETSVWGFFERYEGMFVLLGYILAAVLVINFVNSEKTVKIILYSLAASAVIILTIGLFQYMGHDFFDTGFAKDLIIPSDLRPRLTQFDIVSGGLVFSTMYNSNYVGSYVALLLPVALALVINAKKMFIRILSSVFTVLILINLVGSGSRAGVVGCVAALILFAVLFRKKLLEYKKIVLIALAGLIIIAVSFDLVSGGRIINKVKSVFSGAEASQNAVYLKDLRIDKNKMTIVTDRNQVSMVYENGRVSFYDSKNNPLKSIVSDQGGTKQVILEGKEYSYLKFTFESKMQYTTTTIGDMSFKCYLFPDKLKILGPSGRLYDIQQVPAFGFAGQEKLGSGRGYIWSRTIPMLKDTLLVGHGPDTFPFYFPHDDFVGMLNAYGNTRTFVDKPHNMFLQIGLNTGVLSLIAILVLFLMYFISSIRLYFRRKISTWLDVTGICLLCSFIGYVFAGLFNDSTINVAPVFWVLFGLGIAVNQIIKRQDEKAEKEALNKANTTKKHAKQSQVQRA